MKYIVDRFEENLVICETEQTDFISLERNRLPENVREGDVLILRCGIFIIDADETQKRKEYIKKLTEDLWV